MITLHDGDMLEVIPRLVAEGVVCDAVVTDPPYGLGFMGMAWDTMSLPRRRSGMVRQPDVRWDGDIAFRPETWATVATILRPGAFLLAFGGTRTYHRLVCAIEDAGFVIQDTIAWLYGSGFPKRRDMLKPAIELIVLAHKPGGKRTMRVDECRIPTSASDASAMERCNTPGSGRMYASETPIGTFNRSSSSGVLDTKAGRWPANVCHDGSEEVTEAFPVVHGAGAARAGKFGGDYNASSYDFSGEREMGRFGDSGNAARFFYCAKADAQDRWGSRHPTVKPVELMKWLVALVTPPGGLVLHPFAGTGTTGVAALATGRNAILIEREAAYAADIRERLAFYEGGGTHSVQAKNRSRKTELGPLFEQPFDAALDAALSYDAAIREIGARVKAGEPLPDTGYFNRASAYQMELPYAAE